MDSKLETAKAALEKALKEKGLCVWPVNDKSDVYKLGLFWGVSLSFPGPKEKFDQEINDAYEVTMQIAKNHGLKVNLESPTVCAGGAVAVYCGFQTYLSEIASRKARESGKPIYQILGEDQILLELKESEIVAS